MKEDFPHNVNEEQLARYFAGETSDEEARLIEEWASQSAENREWLQQLQIVWMDTGQLNLEEPEYGRYDLEAAWKKVKARKKQAEKPGLNLSMVWKVAASIVIMVGIGLAGRYYFSGPEKITYHAKDSVSTITLADSSSVVVNKNSRVTYPETFTGERTISLTGEAFFNVKPDPDKPFVVKAGATRIKVVGTSFNVDMDEESITVLVESGKVRFGTGKKDTLLNAGEKGIYSTKNQSVSLDESPSTMGAEQFWRTKTLNFTGQPLTEVTRAVEQAYGVDITIQDENLKHCSLNVTFTDDSLENVLEVISLTLDLDVKKEDNAIILTGKGCPQN